MPTVSAQSVVYVRTTVTELIQGVAQDPTGDSVSWAFLNYGSTPDENTTWYAGSWDSGTPYTARCLIGPSPGVVQLLTGSYAMFLKVTDSPEVPVLQVKGQLTIV